MALIASSMNLDLDSLFHSKREMLSLRKKFRRKKFRARLDYLEMIETAEQNGYLLVIFLWFRQVHDKRYNSQDYALV